MYSYKQIWQDVLQEMKSEFSDVKINTWFADAEIAAIESQYAIVLTGDTTKLPLAREETRRLEKFLHNVLHEFKMIFVFSKDTDGAHIDELKRIIEEGIDNALYDSTIYEMAARLSPQEEPADPADDRSEEISSFFETDRRLDRPAKISANSGHIDYNGDYTFENFVVGNSNRFTYNACYAVATNLSVAWNPLFIYGASGLGKTHLLYAITNEILRRKPDSKIIYVKGDEFTNQLIESIRVKDGPVMFRSKFRQVDVLLIDDIQFIAGKESTQEEFFHTFNSLFEDKKQIILTSDRPPRDIPTLENRLKSRFEWGLIADIQPPDYELRIAIIRSKAEAYGLTLPSVVVEYLAENMKDNIRQIEGSLKRLCAYSSLNGVSVTLDLAKNITQDMLSVDISPQKLQEKIFECVSRHYGVSIADIKGRSKTKEIMFARHVATYLMKNMITGISLKQIGAVFERDHTTVINSVSVIEKKVSAEPLFEREISELKNEIRS